MGRILAFILAFMVGAAGAYVNRYVLTPFQPDVTPIVEPTQVPEVAGLEESKPVYIPFFESFDSDSNYSGWLSVDEFSGMKEVWTVSLWRTSEQTPKWEAAVLTLNRDGSSNDDDSFHSEIITAAGDRLSFRTNTIRGVRYELSGRFFKSGHNFDSNEPVFSGTMKKIRNGKVIAVFAAEFEYIEPHCFH